MLEYLFTKLILLTLGEIAAASILTGQIWIGGKMLYLQHAGYTPQMIQEWIYAHYHIYLPIINLP